MPEETRNLKLETNVVSCEEVTSGGLRFRFRKSDFKFGFGIDCLWRDPQESRCKLGDLVGLRERVM
jgi:hypothetical protein